MSKYIGTPVVNVSVDTVDVTGDITTTDTTPEVIIVNSTHEDTDGGREGKVTFKGQQSGGEETTLAQIQASHDGTSDDEKGDLIFKTNDGSDGASPTERLRFDSSGRASFSNGSIVTIGNSTMGGIAGKVPDTEDFTLAVVGTGFLDSSATLQRFENSSSGPALLLGHSRSGTIGSNTILQDGDELGKIRFFADDGTNMDHYGGEIKVVIDGTPGANDIPSSMVFSTAADGSNSVSERMRLTSDGDLCLGRTSVLYDFGDGRTALTLQGSGSQDYCSLQLGNNGTASNGQIHGLVAFYDGTNENSRIQSIRYSGTDDSHLQFYTSSGGTLSEAARILDDGALIVGDSADIRANSQVGVSIESEGRIFMSRGTGNGGFTHLAFYNGNGLVGSVTTTNAATAFSTSSDYRLKENITDISDGITRVKQLAPKRFNWIADETNTAIDGFLAHEAQTVVPEAITGTKDETEAIGNVKDSDGNNIKTGVTKPDTLEEGHTWTETGTQPVMQGIDQSKLVPLLTAALQEAIAKIETLETKVAALEG